MRTDRAWLMQWVRNSFGAQPEYLWADMPNAAVFRHRENRKWFCLMMEVSAKKLGFSTDEMVDICNVKCDPLMLGSVLEKTGCFPAYHMNKQHWLTILLNGSVSEEDVQFLLEQSYDLTSKKSQKIVKNEK